MPKNKLVLACLTMLLVACTATPAPTASPTPLAVTTPTLVTLAPTARPTSPPVGASPTAGAVEAVTPTVEPPTRFGPANFPPNINPLTGLSVSDPAQLMRRPLAIKVSQFPRRVRPQAGLSLADLVWEHYAEAGVTRLTAIYLAQDVAKVGSIRSARLIDIVLAESYKAMLVTSGSSEGTLKRLSLTDFYDRVIAEATGYTDCPPLCREEGAGLTTDKLFASTAAVWQVTDSLGINTAQNLNGMAFEQAAPAGGTPGETIHLDFQTDNTIVEWRYAPATGQYARWVDTATPGELAPHADLNNAEQLAAANVVVLYVNHVPTDIVEDFENGGHCGYEIQLWGSGPAKLFRDGQAYDLTWVRFSTADVIGFVGPDNQIFAFKPGHTWFELLNFNSPTTFEAGTFTARFKGPSQSANCPVGGGG